MSVPRSAGRIRTFLHDHDPDRYAAHRAIRAAVAVPAGFALAVVLFDDPQLATFAAFGGFALLLFVDFPGDRASRAAAYALLALTGCGLIVLGTLASTATALAVCGMAAVGFTVLFAGVLSASVAAAGRAALLTFILPVTLPGSVGDIGPRLTGFAIAVAVAVPTALFVWPPPEHDQLRRDGAATCRGLADVVTARLSDDDARGDGAVGELTRALTALRAAFRGTEYRPVGLTTGSRVLIRLVDELEWLGSVVRRLDPDRVRRWPPLPRAAADAAVDVLRASTAVLLERPRSSSDSQRRLLEANRRLEAARAEVAAHALSALSADDYSLAVPYHGHELGYASSLVGETVSWAAAADSRPVLDRVLGRPAAGATSQLSPAIHIATSQVQRHSVWLQNSVRGAAGLALAVLLARVLGAQHAFWTVLGTMSILRSNALSTGANAVRAVLGTVAGFAVGGVLVYLIGTQTAVLWAALPVAVLVAGFAPAAVSFAAGQAAFTVVVLVLFNIIKPVGWTVGLVRIEDVLLGCAASLAVGLLLWPRGAAAAIGTALADAYRSGASYFDDAVTAALGRSASPEAVRREAVRREAVRREALAAGRRLDDALRQYLAERGAKAAPLGALTAAANGATRLRLAGDAIRTLRPGDTDTDVQAADTDVQAAHADVQAAHADVQAADADAGAADAQRLPVTTAALTAQAISVRDWYEAVGEFLDPHRPRSTAPRPRPAGEVADVLTGLRAELTSAADASTRAQGRRLLWTALYVQDMRILETRVVPPVTAVENRAGRKAGRWSFGGRPKSAAEQISSSTPAPGTS